MVELPVGAVHGEQVERRLMLVGPGGADSEARPVLEQLFLVHRPEPAGGVALEVVGGDADPHQAR